MKSIIISLICLIVAPIGPFAPVAEKPANPDNSPDIEIAIRFLEAVVIPEEDEVGFPACPNAQIIQTSRAGEMTSMNIVRVYTSESPENVLSFYQGEVPDAWEYKEFYGLHYLFNGDEMKAMMGEVPCIQIEPPDAFKHIWPEAKTILTIYY